MTSRSEDIPRWAQDLVEILNSIDARLALIEAWIETLDAECDGGEQLVLWEHELYRDKGRDH